MKSLHDGMKQMTNVLKQTHLKDAHIVLLTNFFRTVFVWCGFVSYHCQWQYTLCTVFKSIHIPLEPHSTFFTTNNGSKIVLCAIGCTPQWICFVLLKLFGTRIRHIVLLTDFSRTVFVWCGFVSYHCQ